MSVPVWWMYYIYAKDKCFWKSHLLCLLPLCPHDSQHFILSPPPTHVFCDHHLSFSSASHSFPLLSQTTIISLSYTSIYIFFISRLFSSYPIHLSGLPLFLAITTGRKQTDKQTNQQVSYIIIIIIQYDYHLTVLWWWLFLFFFLLFLSTSSVLARLCTGNSSFVMRL